MSHSIPVVPATAISEILDVLQGYEDMKKDRYERRHVEQYLDQVRRKLLTAEKITAPAILASDAHALLTRLQADADSNKAGADITALIDYLSAAFGLKNIRKISDSKLDEMLAYVKKSAPWRVTSEGHEGWIVEGNHPTHNVPFEVGFTIMERAADVFAASPMILEDLSSARQELRDLIDGVERACRAIESRGGDASEVAAVVRNFKSTAL